jgi:D-aminopeptidase
MRALVIAAIVFSCCVTASASPAGMHFGEYPSGPNDGITDVPGVRVAHLTKIEGSDVRTGATAILPNSDPWNNKVSAASQAYNGNGEMTGTHWVNEAGYLESPIVLTDTLDIGRADDGVISWMMRRYPQIGLHDDVPLPVVAECDDQLLSDIRGRQVSADDVAALIDRTQTGQFARGSVGAGTGMRAFGFKAGIGSASRVLPKDLGGYTVGALVNDNTGSSRQLLTIDGVHVGRALKNEFLPLYPKRTGQTAQRMHGRQTDGSIVVIIATDAPLDSRQLRAVTKRIELGMGRVGLTSQIGSGDLFLAFSTTFVFKRDADYTINAPANQFVENEDTLNAIYAATVEATENAIYDALFSARTMTGRGGVTIYGLPVDRVTEMLRKAP